MDIHDRQDGVSKIGIHFYPVYPVHPCRVILNGANKHD